MKRQTLCSDSENDSEDDFQKSSFLPTKKLHSNQTAVSSDVPSVAVAQSRFANSKAKRPLSSRFKNHDEQLHQMAAGMKLLQKSQMLLYGSDDLTAELVQRFSVLEQFVCWSCKSGVTGVTKSTSGGKYNVAVYFKVGPHKFQAHKLSLCHKLALPYTQLEPNGFDASHLCHTKACWRDSHLHNESHASNMARNSGIGCAGWLFDVQLKHLACLCRHEPRCMFVRVFQHIEWTNIV